MNKDTFDMMIEHFKIEFKFNPFGMFTISAIGKYKDIIGYRSKESKRFEWYLAERGENVPMIRFVEDNIDYILERYDTATQ